MSLPKKAAPERRDRRESGMRVREALVGGRYKVVRELGVGAMGVVQLAVLVGPSGFRKRVALKRIHAHLCDDEAIVRMFVDEARLVARLSHPNVAQVFDLLEERGAYFIVMEYLHGESLRDVVRRCAAAGRPLAHDAACAVVEGAAEGLHAAHELEGGLVHRDVSPENLVVTYDGQVKVVDFGVARWKTGATATRAGVLKGKLSYMSPEQAMGDTIDRRTDVFALGVVLWELTTGRRLFRGKTELETLVAVQKCEVPLPTTVVAGYPPALERIVMAALARRRDDRFATARDLSHALRVMPTRGKAAPHEDLERLMRRLFADRIAERAAVLDGDDEADAPVQRSPAPSPPPAADDDDEPTVISMAPPEVVPVEEETTVTLSVPPPPPLPMGDAFFIPPAPVPQRTPTSPRLPPVMVWSPRNDATMRLDVRSSSRMWWLVAGAVIGGALALAIMIWLAWR